ncbi:MAG: N-acetyl-gamma-glutamyl-phosphate reductase [Firmicutes bacterium ADurb.Bin146]|nr:MAG: N-acetyl-gamma-glutamyl-phosphate reductase [Firmicutes bacterium ADurb.Bin146]
MVKVFIDGSAGTTGLRIHKRLEKRDDITLISLCDSDRKDKTQRKKALNSADIAFLCLPDEAAMESVSLVDNPDTIIIDASTAHRTDPDWTYGLLELGDDVYSKVKNSKRICIPGCHATGFISLVEPLIENGIVCKDYPFSCFSLTGYSGGGKSMINQYQDKNRDASLSSPRIYALTQKHKHLNEMKLYSNISEYPLFNPVVLDIYSMMCVTVNISAKEVKLDEVQKAYTKKYANRPLFDVSDISAQSYNGFIPSDAFKDKDSIKITVTGNDERISLIALYDNLGKGASGAAIQIFNVITGNKETKGLNI